MKRTNYFVYFAIFQCCLARIFLFKKAQDKIFNDYCPWFSTIFRAIKKVLYIFQWPVESVPMFYFYFSLISVVLLYFVKYFVFCFTFVFIWFWFLHFFFIWRLYCLKNMLVVQGCPELPPKPYPFSFTNFTSPILISLFTTQLPLCSMYIFHLVLLIPPFCTP